MAVSDAQHAAVRHATTRDCVITLRDAAGPLTISEIAQSTGLSRPTVGAVLQDLEATGLLRTIAPGAQGQPGRPARRVELDARSGRVAAVDIGARSVRCVITDVSGEVHARSAVPLEGSDPVQVVLEAIREAGGSPQAVGISAPGIVDGQGCIVQSLAVPRLSGIPLAAAIGETMGCSVVVENDIKLAAYAEHHLGSSAAGLVYVQIGHRISVSIVVAGEILHGSHRLAGELGIQRGMRWTPSSARGRLTWSTGDEARPLVERARDGDAAAREEIEAFCGQIAPRLAGLLLAVDPEVVVIGGGLSRAGETFLAPLRRALDHQLMTPHSPTVIAAKLPTDGSLVGALGRASEAGSSSIFGVPGVPPPWRRLLEVPADPADRPADPSTAPDPSTEPDLSTVPDPSTDSPYSGAITP